MFLAPLNLRLKSQCRPAGEKAEGGPPPLPGPVGGQGVRREVSVAEVWARVGASINRLLEATYVTHRIRGLGWKVRLGKSY